MIAATPRRASAATPSGIRPSPHALSIGGCALSATTTLKPRRRAAIAAASSAGPPPITKTSVSLGSSSIASPPDENHLRTEPRTHRQQYAERSGRGPVLHYHVFQHQQDRSRRQVAAAPQAFPRTIELAIAEFQRVLNSLEHLGPARVN